MKIKDLPKILKLWDICRSLDEGRRDRSREKSYSWITPVKDIVAKDIDILLGNIKKKI